MEINRIYNMDCLDGMKEITDKSVNMVLTDIPYGGCSGFVQGGLRQNDQFIVRGLRILDCTTGLFVSYPVDPFYKGEDLRCIAQPITRNLRENIEKCILEKYQEISSLEE